MDLMDRGNLAAALRHGDMFLGHDGTINMVRQAWLVLGCSHTCPLSPLIVTSRLLLILYAACLMQQDVSLHHGDDL